MWVLQRSQVWFTLLESRGISACRNKCASSSMSGWETKNIWGWCLPPPALAQPRHLPLFLPTTAKATGLLPGGEQLEALPQHIAHVQIKQQHKQGGGSKCALSAGTESHQTEWEQGDKCSVLELAVWQLLPKGLSLECATCQFGLVESV